MEDFGTVFQGAVIGSIINLAAAVMDQFRLHQQAAQIAKQGPFTWQAAQRLALGVGAAEVGACRLGTAQQAVAQQQDQRLAAVGHVTDLGQQIALGDIFGTQAPFFARGFVLRLGVLGFRAQQCTASAELQEQDQGDNKQSDDNKHTGATAADREINTAITLYFAGLSRACNVGKEIFTRSGPAIVEGLHSKGFEVFLDLKFHDIPNTVAGAVAAAADLGVWMVNVHASGGQRMMEAAANAIANHANRPHLIAVTVLTSMEAADLEQVGVMDEPNVQVQRLAELAKRSGMDGVVCSAQEATMLKEACGRQFELITPGIRPAGADAGDQRRVLTPVQARDAGVDYMVIGRPITQAAEPTAVVDEILQSLA